MTKEEVTKKLPLELLFKKEEVKSIIENTTKEEVKVDETPKETKKDLVKPKEVILVKGKKYTFKFFLNVKKSCKETLYFYNSENKLLFTCEANFDHYTTTTEIVFKQRGKRIQSKRVKTNMCKLLFQFNRVKTTVQVNDLDLIPIKLNCPQNITEKVTWTCDTMNCY